MDILNMIKIIAAIISLIIAFTVGIIVLRLNPDNWLNRWFFLFFISIALGFLLYSIYHFIYTGSYTKDSDIIIPLMITAQIFFNFIPISLVMTVLILEKYKKVAMSLKYLGTMFALLIIMSIGYFILPPTLNEDKYADKIIDTETEFAVQIIANVLRIALFAYVVYKYVIITRKIEIETKRRVQWFFMGIILAIIGLIINLIGAIIFEIAALIIIDVGMVLIFKGFLI
ncbi:MAG: hypothetical protein ACFFBC_07985 [Promethearchaeota archaeon]